MSGSRTERVLLAMERERATAILRTALVGAVRPALQAAAEGGFRVLEVTLNTPGALAAIRALAGTEGLTIGAGTVLSTDAAERAADAGAEFLVSPVADADVIAWCAERDLLAVPGTFTPAEMLGAHRAGAHVVKLFPAPPDGPGYVRSVLGPLPFLRIVPTSGVTGANAAEFLAAGAFAVGFVNALFAPEDLSAGRYGAIRDRAAGFLDGIAAYRKVDQ